MTLLVLNNRAFDLIYSEIKPLGTQIPIQYLKRSCLFRKYILPEWGITVMSEIRSKNKFKEPRISAYIFLGRMCA